MDAFLVFSSQLHLCKPALPCLPLTPCLWCHLSNQQKGGSGCSPVVSARPLPSATCQPRSKPAPPLHFPGCRSVVIGATNRKADLDAALLSRFDLIVTFGLPDEQCREKILQRYARHLTAEEVRVVACNGSRGGGRGTAGSCGHIP